MPESEDGLSKQKDSSVNDWMIDEHGEFIDLHAKLHSYSDVIDFLQHIERAYSIREYCNGNNAGARWLFQIYSIEFIQELAFVIEDILSQIVRNGPILEVMAGDGRLAEFLGDLIDREYVATDAKSERYNIAYPKWVHKLDAEEAIQKFNPAIVVMSWEPRYSEKGIEIADTGVPMIWIGNPNRCGHSNLFQENHHRLHSKHCISRHDVIREGIRATDVFLFNCDLGHIDSLL